MIELDVIVASEAWERVDARRWAREAAEMVSLHEVAEGGATLLLTDDAQLQTLNRSYRGLDKPTNVLSFPAPAIPNSGPRFWGDVAIAFETVSREAQDHGKTLEAHVRHIIVHGLLHLLGHDHVLEEEAARMEALEARILAAMGVADPYIERGEDLTEP